jgi:hypothetical protein
LVLSEFQTWKFNLQGRAKTDFQVYAFARIVIATETGAGRRMRGWKHTYNLAGLVCGMVAGRIDGGEKRLASGWSEISNLFGWTFSGGPVDRLVRGR